MIEVEGVNPDDFTMTSTSKRFQKGGEFNGAYTRGQGSGSYSVRPIKSSLQTVVGGRLDILGEIVQNRVTDPQ